MAEAKNCSSKYQNVLQTELTSKGISDHVKDALQGTVSAIVFKFMAITYRIEMIITHIGICDEYLVDIYHYSSTEIGV